MSKKDDKDDPIAMAAAELMAKLEDKRVAHEAEMASQNYIDISKHFHGSTDQFLSAVTACRTMTMRSPAHWENMLIFRQLDDLIQSSIALFTLIQNGMHNPAMREMRFMLESGVKYLYVDQQKPSASFTDRVTYLKSDVDRSSIDMAPALSLAAFDEATHKNFTDEIKDLYRKQCAYIHPSQSQIMEMAKRFHDEKGIGFETSAELGRVTKVAFRLYDILLALLFHGLGLESTGDLFVQVFDKQPRWKFHKGKYVSQVSAYFSYKAERQ